VHILSSYSLIDPRGKTVARLGTKQMTKCARNGVLTPLRTKMTVLCIVYNGGDAERTGSHGDILHLYERDGNRSSSNRVGFVVGLVACV